MLGAALASSSGTNLTAKIDTLRKEQQTIKAQRQQVMKELKNAQKRKRRLKARAKQLSNEDLLALMCMRQSESSASTAVPPEDPSGAATADGAARPDPTPAQGAAAALLP